MATTPANSMNLNSTTSGLVNWDGSSIMSSTPLTQYNVLTGASSNTIHNSAPTATSGIPLISQGSVSQPVFGTAVVAGGGTGDTSFTAYSVICGGTSSTGALQNVSGVGTSGQVLTSNGAAALPTWQDASAGGLQILKSSTFNMKSATAQSIITTPASNFVLTQLIFVSVSITGWSSPSSYTVGYTAATYSDLIAFGTDSFQGNVNNAYYSYVAFGDGLTGEPAFIIPPSKTIFVNVTGAGTATTYTEFCYLVGFVQF